MRSETLRIWISNNFLASKMCVFKQFLRANILLYYAKIYSLKIEKNVVDKISQAKEAIKTSWAGSANKNELGGQRCLRCCVENSQNFLGKLFKTMLINE